MHFVAPFGRWIDRFDSLGTPVGADWHGDAGKSTGVRTLAHVTFGPFLRGRSGLAVFGRTCRPKVLGHSPYRCNLYPVLAGGSTKTVPEGTTSFGSVRSQYHRQLP